MRGSEEKLHQNHFPEEKAFRRPNCERPSDQIYIKVARAPFAAVLVEQETPKVYKYIHEESSKLARNLFKTIKTKNS